MEIERKFLVTEIPSLKGCKKFEIKQGYISVDPVIRIRKSNSNYFLTIKGQGSIIREEHEMPITSKQFETLLLKIESNLIEKDRYLINLHNGLIAELDVFLGIYKGLALVEVEFNSIEDANTFTPPHWFAHEVTEDYKYTNSYLSKNLNM